MSWLGLGLGVVGFLVGKPMRRYMIAGMLLLIPFMIGTQKDHPEGWLRWDAMGPLSWLAIIGWAVLLVAYPWVWRREQAWKAARSAQDGVYVYAERHEAPALPAPPSEPQAPVYVPVRGSETRAQQKVRPKLIIPHVLGTTKKHRIETANDGTVITDRRGFDPEVEL